MLLALLLAALSATPQDSPAWTIFDRNVTLGHVPQLMPPPANLPEPKSAVDGVLLPTPLDGYVGAQLTALKLYPALAQKALDNAVIYERDVCSIKLADARATESTWWDRLRSGALWAVGGAAVGAVAGGLIVGYVLR